MRSATVGLVVLMLVTAEGVAQPVTVVFSGIWVMDRTRSEAAVQEQPVGPVTVTISQTGSALRLETTRDGKTEVAIYPIGPNPSMAAEVTGVRRAFWDGQTLVNEGSKDIQGKTIAFREARTVSADGAEMIVETTVKLEHGYEMKGAQTIVTGKNVYVRGR
jgi:hypothetical protein